MGLVRDRLSPDAGPDVAAAKGGRPLFVAVLVSVFFIAVLVSVFFIAFIEVTFVFVEVLPRRENDLEGEQGCKE
eukprot:evm.model.NODE_27915_length_27726_cov_40.572170.3